MYHSDLSFIHGPVRCLIHDCGSRIASMAQSPSGKMCTLHLVTGTRKSCSYDPAGPDVQIKMAIPIPYVRVVLHHRIDDQGVSAPRSLEPPSELDIVHQPDIASLHE